MENKNLEKWVTVAKGEVSHRLKIEDRLFTVWVNENPIRVIRSDSRRISDYSIGFDYPVSIQGIETHYAEIIQEYVDTLHKS